MLCRFSHVNGLADPSGNSPATTCVLRPCDLPLTQFVPIGDTAAIDYRRRRQGMKAFRHAGEIAPVGITPQLGATTEVPPEVPLRTRIEPHLNDRRALRNEHHVGIEGLLGVPLTEVR